MKERVLSAYILDDFKKYLILQEKSSATVQKYIHDVSAFANFVNGESITKETVIAYKNHLKENYAVRSVNSVLASINGLFSFLVFLYLQHNIDFVV